MFSCFIVILAFFPSIPFVVSINNLQRLEWYSHFIHIAWNSLDTWSFFAWTPKLQVSLDPSVSVVCYPTKIVHLIIIRSVVRYNLHGCFPWLLVQPNVEWWIDLASFTWFTRYSGVSLRPCHKLWVNLLDVSYKINPLATRIAIVQSYSSFVGASIWLAFFS